LTGLSGKNKSIIFFRIESENRELYAVVQALMSLCSAAILIAETAASSPLFPYLPPALSLACSRFWVVRTPKIKGILLFRFN
jgi:hypothetical protein